MSGVGAWSFGYYHQGMDVPNDRVAAGVLAFKQAAIDNGFKDRVVLNSTFGKNFKKQVVAFQESKNINADGIIGPETARYLFRIYSYKVEHDLSISNHYLQKIGGQESGHDPVAQGFVDERDEGWAQISLSNHPDITQKQAWTPSFAIPWAGKYLLSFYNNQSKDWEGAVASYNVGSFYAKEWIDAGKPSSGGPVVDGQDIFSRATQYVKGVSAQAV